MQTKLQNRSYDKDDVFGRWIDHLVLLQEETRRGAGMGEGIHANVLFNNQLNEDDCHSLIHMTLWSMLSDEYN